MVAKNFDLSSFERKRKPPSQEQDACQPLWVTEGSEATRKLYELVLQEVELIELRIKTGEKLSLNDRRVVKSRIAKRAQYDPSLLTRRRQPDLLVFIGEQDEALNELWKNYQRKAPSGVKRLKRVDLEREVTRLKRKNKDLSDQFCRESIESALGSVFLKSQLQLSKENAELRGSIDRANQTISNLRSELRSVQLRPVK